MIFTDRSSSKGAPESKEGSRLSWANVIKRFSSPLILQQDKLDYCPDCHTFAGNATAYLNPILLKTLFFGVICANAAANTH
jgi:hypothetical protein